jgi:hypothetical protein
VVQEGLVCPQLPDEVYGEIISKFFEDLYGNCNLKFVASQLIYLILVSKVFCKEIKRRCKQMNTIRSIDLQRTDRDFLPPEIWRKGLLNVFWS